MGPDGYPGKLYMLVSRPCMDAAAGVGACVEPSAYPMNAPLLTSPVSVSSKSPKSSRSRSSMENPFMLMPRNLANARVCEAEVSSVQKLIDSYFTGVVNSGRERHFRIYQASMGNAEQQSIVTHIHQPLRESVM